jgi:replication-associated recombination protein RarA
MNKFDDFIFNAELEKKLNWLLDNPKKIPPVLCFYGYPGNGKSSFAKFIAKKVGATDHYFDMNEYCANGKSFGDMLERIKWAIIQKSVFGDYTKPWKRVIILDEFHNATKRQQDTLKITLESHSKNNNCLFILCLNVNNGGYLEDEITPAIASRVFPISFNTKTVDLPELTQAIKNKFPKLDIEDINRDLPEML